MKDLYYFKVGKLFISAIFVNIGTIHLDAERKSAYLHNPAQAKNVALFLFDNKIPYTIYSIETHEKQVKEIF